MVTVPVMVSEGKTLASDGVEVCSGKDGGGRRHRETRVQVMIIQGRIKKKGRWLALKLVQRRDVPESKVCQPRDVEINVATFQRIRFSNVETL